MKHSPIILRNDLHSKFGVFLHKTSKGFCFKCSDFQKLTSIRFWLSNCYPGLFGMIDDGCGYNWIFCK